MELGARMGRDLNRGEERGGRGLRESKRRQDMPGKGKGKPETESSKEAKGDPSRRQHLSTHNTVGTLGMNIIKIQSLGMVLLAAVSNQTKV